MKKRMARFLSLFILMTALCIPPIAAHAAGKMSLQWKSSKRTVEKGRKLTLKVKIRNKKRGAKLSWTSSNRKIATVSQKGVVSGRKAGKVKITVKIRGTKIKQTCKIRVVKPTQTQKPSPGSTNPTPQKTTVPTGSTPSVPTAVPSAAPTASSAGATATPVNSPASTATPDTPTAAPSGEPTDPTTVPSGEPAVPTGSPSIAPASPEPTYIPGDDELIPYSGVMEIQGETMTVYLVNKNYDGSFRVRMNGKEFSTGGSAKDALFALAYGGTTKENSAGTIRISRTTDESGNLVEYWTVEDLEQGLTYEMKAETRNNIKPSIANCGVIYFRGDVTSAIEVY